ncbi:hypothetical protein [Streptomyces sp. NPDC007916]|uniref:hypothetical protein n=1 Tax=Streptomyces sp. NPDC007916 TaxID=3364792 RepID=UPI0036E9C043
MSAESDYGGKAENARYTDEERCLVTVVFDDAAVRGLADRVAEGDAGGDPTEGLGDLVRRHQRVQKGVLGGELGARVSPVRTTAAAMP